MQLSIVVCHFFILHLIKEYVPFNLNAEVLGNEQKTVMNEKKKKTFGGCIRTSCVSHRRREFVITHLHFSCSCGQGVTSWLPGTLHCFCIWIFSDRLPILFSVPQCLRIWVLTAGCIWHFYWSHMEPFALPTLTVMPIIIYLQCKILYYTYKWVWVYGFYWR